MECQVISQRFCLARRRFMGDDNRDRQTRNAMEMCSVGSEINHAIVSRESRTMMIAYSITLQGR